MHKGIGYLQSSSSFVSSANQSSSSRRVIGVHHGFVLRPCFSSSRRLEQVIQLVSFYVTDIWIHWMFCPCDLHSAMFRLSIFLVDGRPRGSIWNFWTQRRQNWAISFENLKPALMVRNCALMFWTNRAATPRGCAVPLRAYIYIILSFERFRHHYHQWDVQHSIPICHL